MMMSSRLIRTSLSGITARVLPTLQAAAFLPHQHPLSQHQTVRTKMTKTKRRRLEKKAKQAADALRGIFPPKPVHFMDKKTPVINAIPSEERSLQSKEAERKASEELQARLQEQNNDESPMLRCHMTGLRMSDRVRKLFDLTNGNQSEVVSAQKHRGMELFQRREGDTGSSAVQVIALTTRIQQLQTHFKTHRKDQHSKRGMDALYVRRRKLLDYMERKEFESYRKVVKTLGLVR